jgi:hypothetical protein
VTSENFAVCQATKRTTERFGVPRSFLVGKMCAVVITMRKLSNENYVQGYHNLVFYVQNKSD